MTKSNPIHKANGAAEPENGEAEPQAELALIYCYRNAVGISRKVDPEVPLPIQQQRIEADQLLAYDRRTGDFFVPGKGKVYLYDRGDKPSQTEEPNTDATMATKHGNRNPKPAQGQRTVTQTSGTIPESQSREYERKYDRRHQSRKTVAASK